MTFFWSICWSFLTNETKIFSEFLRPTNLGIPEKQKIYRPPEPHASHRFVWSVFCSLAESNGTVCWWITKKVMSTFKCHHQNINFKKNQTIEWVLGQPILIGNDSAASSFSIESTFPQLPPWSTLTGWLPIFDESEREDDMIDWCHKGHKCEREKVWKKYYVH